MQHQISDIITLFNQTFSHSENTRLVAGGEEPWYLPAHANCAYHQIVFAHGFFASALHEIAHWLIAGKQRRMQIDYGYWYEADGRSATQQLDFAKVEAKPQALEWLLSMSCRFPFVISLDNLSGEAVDITPFKQALIREITRFQQQGVGERAERFIAVLRTFYQQHTPYQHYVANLEDLR